MTLPVTPNPVAASSLPPGQEGAGSVASPQKEAFSVITSVLQNTSKWLLGAEHQDRTCRQPFSSGNVPCVCGLEQVRNDLQWAILLSENFNEEQGEHPVNPKPEKAPVRQEEGEWTASFQGRDYIVYSGEREILRVKDAVEETIAAVDDLILAFNASLRDKTEQEKTQAWADHEGLLQCRALLNVQEGDNLYDAIKRLAAEKEASERNTHVLQKALAGLIESWRRRMLICREAARGQYLKGQADTFEDCCYELEKVLSEHAPKSVLGPRLNPHHPDPANPDTYVPSPGSGLPKAEEE